MVNASSNDTIGLLSELIQNRCVNPPGDEMKPIRTVHRTLQEHGIESWVFESAPNRGNLVSRIKGDDGPRLMFGPAHVDVVPVEDAGSWEEDPFSGNVKDGYVWGRGARATGRGSTTSTSNTMSCLYLEWREESLSE